MLYLPTVALKITSNARTVAIDMPYFPKEKGYARGLQQPQDKIDIKDTYPLSCKPTSHLSRYSSSLQNQNSTLFYGYYNFADCTDIMLLIRPLLHSTQLQLRTRRTDTNGRYQKKCQGPTPQRGTSDQSSLSALLCSF